MMQPSKTILIMAGGTGGHIIPALAVAKALQSHGVTIHWLGTERGLEQKLIASTDIPLHLIKMRGVRGKGIWGLGMAPFRMLYATFEAVHIIRKIKPQIVLGFGGFVAAPGGVAAWLLRKPLILHEQNAAAGMTNRCLAYLTTQLFQAFPKAFPKKFQAITCGNPVRTEILTLPLPEQRFNHRDSTLRLLVLGGSQGAILLNQIVPESLATLAQSVEVWHATGKSAVETTQDAYQRLGISTRVTEFIQDMAAAYAWADLVICRAGALTVAELAAAGVASILIPYPHAVDDHQTKNAMWLVNAGAAILMPQNILNAHLLQQQLAKFLANRNHLLQMAIAARKLAITDATQKIAAECLKLLER
jgi:UDP-N-acetylglucosamine--N-acetylmuramyl-(pentapeptide) pyrophosphoryl-undecaprenol N-acetylglucosamine transferase